MSVPQAQFDGMASEPNKKVLRPHIRVGATFYPHANDPIFSSRSVKRRYLNWDRNLTEGTITNWSWSKRMGEPSGRWSITAKLGRSAAMDILGGDLIDGDWVDIEVMRNGIVFPICRGVLDTVREQTQSVGGATVRTISLTGRDHGALFETPIAWANIYAQSVSELLLGIHTAGLKSEIGGSPSRMFELWINATFGQKTSAVRSAWQFPPALASRTSVDRFGDELEVRNSSETRGSYWNEISAWTQAGQSLHQAFGQWCNPLLNEFWYDLENPQDPTATRHGQRMEATIRERPFINDALGLDSPWFDVPEWTIPSWMIESRDLGRGGTERFTIFELLADYSHGNAQEQPALAPPTWSKNAVSSHGIKPYLENTKYVQVVNGDQGGWVAERNVWQDLVVSWFAANPYWLSGTLNIATMLPEIRVGNRLRLATGDSTGLSGYIEGVEHEYQFASDGNRGPHSRTRLQLTRGFEGSDKDLVDLVRDSKKTFTEGF